MHQHGSNELSGPVRGTSAWWQGTGAPPIVPNEGASVLTCTEKGKRMARGKRGARSIRSESIRMDVVERVRREIAARDYDSPQKWESALDRLLERLDSD